MSKHFFRNSNVHLANEIAFRLPFGHFSYILLPLPRNCVLLIRGHGCWPFIPLSMAPSLQIQFSPGQGLVGDDWSMALQLVIFMTLLMLGPSIVMLTTGFTRIVIVLGFVRNAIGVASSPSNQIVIGLSLFLTLFLMGPVWEGIYENAVQPYNEKKITSQKALSIGSDHLKRFMLGQTRPKDIEFFLELSRKPNLPKNLEDLSLTIIIPAFLLSELRTAFQMGFMIFIPFLIIDFLVASTLMSMGMMMMPPAILSLPFKILLFVLVDGWTLIIKSLLKSFMV